ncbi:hypothetical protein FRC02_003137 [Tulasnella sp. 418]|nr:hypothetical protein FRC02_003137 [Tulasnella sp. 418]
MLAFQIILAGLSSRLGSCCDDPLFCLSGSWFQSEARIFEEWKKMGNRSTSRTAERTSDQWTASWNSSARKHIVRASIGDVSLAGIRIPQMDRICVASHIHPSVQPVVILA